MARVGAGPTVEFTVTPTLDTSAYVSGDLLFDTTLIDSTFSTPLNHTAIIQSVGILDDGDVGLDLDLLFLNQSTTLGTINAAFAASDALLAQLTGNIVTVAAADYDDLIGAQYASPQFNPFVVATDSNRVPGLYVAGVARAGGTFAADDLHLKIGVIF
jgi:hypothetical protein